MRNSHESFSEKGVELQMNAQSWYAAKRSYLYSCMLCCTRGIGIKCEVCPIRQALLTNAEIFKPKMDEKEKSWVEKEWKLL